MSAVDLEQSRRDEQMALVEYERVNKLVMRVIEERSVVYRWIMASLFILNSGGLFGIVNSGKSGGEWVLASGTAFYLGIGFAFAVGRFGQQSNDRVIEQFSDIQDYWRRLARSGKTAFKSEPDTYSVYFNPSGFSKMTRTFALLSFAAFSVGCALVAIDASATKGQQPHQMSSEIVVREYVDQTEEK